MSNIGPLVTISVPDVNEVMDDYTSIQLEAASSYGGSYSLITIITLVADDTEYSYRYASGAATTYFRYRFYNSTGPVASNYSEPFAASTAPATTRQELRQRAAYRLGAGQAYGVPPTEWTFPGPSGTTTGAGSTTTIVCSNFASSAFMDTGSATASRVFDGWSVYISSGTQSGTERRVADNGLNESSGTFTVSPAWSGAPGSGVTFELYGCGITASEWNKFLDDARLELWYPAEVAIAGVTGQTEYALPYWVERDEQVLSFGPRTGDTLAQHRFYRGTPFEIRPVEGGGCVLYVADGIPDNQVYILQVQRHPAPFTSDTAAVTLAEQYQRIWWLTAAMRAAQSKAQSPLGNTENTKLWQDRYQQLELERQGAVSEVAWRVQRSPRRTPLVPIGGGRWGGGWGGSARSAYY